MNGWILMFITMSIRSTKELSLLFYFCLFYLLLIMESTSAEIIEHHVANPKAERSFKENVNSA